ncbi:hypothetical protein D3230_15600 [Leucobacter chromiireducens subsp. solipictus]|uniref:Uncharacterized protein n=1 Tax=Leucobacter chromiireducens subsp. solipictus TaxID=398235 RepID=A0ABS1SJG1_9MICO|nr:hypothetical protein [Leucobacter chromiireducens subsp. solipictus]
MEARARHHSCTRHRRDDRTRHNRADESRSRRHDRDHRRSGRSHGYSCWDGHEPLPGTDRAGRWLRELWRELC